MATHLMSAPNDLQGIRIEQQRFWTFDVKPNVAERSGLMSSNPYALSLRRA
jgi:hypothetical protein